MRRHLRHMILLCVLGCFLVHFVRASFRDVTHDEAVTWFFYARNSLASIFTPERYDANNHLLHSALCNITFNAMGSGPLVLRLPALAGTLIFLLGIFYVCTRFLHSPLLALLATGVLALNPLIFDFCSLARGYSLALAFLLVAFCGLADTLRRPDRVSEPSRVKGRLVGASLAMGLSVLVHPHFMFTNGALALAYLIVATIAADRHRRGFLSYLAQSACLLCLPAAVLAGGVYGKIITMPRLRAGNQINGTDSLMNAARDLLEFSLGLKGHHDASVISRPELAGRVTFLVTLLGLLLAALIALLAWRAWKLWHHPSRRCRADDCLLGLCGFTFLINLGLLGSAYHTFGIHYPTGRLGLSLILAFNLWLVLALNHLCWRQAGWRRAWKLALASGVLLIYYQAWQIRPSAWYTLETNMAHIAMSLDQWASRHGNKEPSVDVDWVLRPSLEYYRFSRGQAVDVTLRTNEKRVFTPGADAYICMPNPSLRKNGLQILAQGADSGACLAIPFHLTAKPSSPLAGSMASAARSARSTSPAVRDMSEMVEP